MKASDLKGEPATAAEALHIKHKQRLTIEGSALDIDDMAGSQAQSNESQRVVPFLTSNSAP